MLQRSFKNSEGLPRTYAARHRRLPGSVVWVMGCVGALLILVSVGSYFVNEPLRRYMETTLNGELRGYTVRLPALDFHPFGFSLTLRGLTVAQQAHPVPPVARFPQLDASVHWRALLRGRLVAEFRFLEPRVVVDRSQLQHEAADPLPLKRKGWQQALETIYPLKINRLRIENGDLTYIDDDPRRPLHIRQVNLVADNIRNLRSPDHVYPSDIDARGIIFDTGTFHFDGKANFLAEPFAGIDAEVAVQRIDLTYFKPILARLNLSISNGSLSGDGHVEYAPRTRNVHVRHLTIQGIRLDYVHTAQTATAEKERAVEVGHAAEEISHARQLVILVDELHIAKSTIGYVDQASEPSYRVFLVNSDLSLTQLSNQAQKPPAYLYLDGQFMGSGYSQVQATFQPAAKTPDLYVSIMIEGTPLPRMNDLLRRVANFDVVAGKFSVYSQLSIRDGDISGYLKPIFSGVQVYSRPQDADKPVLHQLYERTIGGLKAALQNRNGEVGTKVDISGRASDPEASTWEIVLGLLENAFVKAIGHGFEQVPEGSPPEGAQPGAGIN